MSNQLLPCPFCGGPAEQEEARINDEWAVSHIRCKKRCAVQPSAEGWCALFYWSSLQKENVRTCSDDKAKLEATEKAYANWNRRATQPAAGEPVYQWHDSTTWQECASKRDYLHAKDNGLRVRVLWEAPPAAAHGHVPSVSGIGRDAGHPRALVLYLRSEPTDDDIRAIQGALRGNAAAHGDEADRDEAVIQCLRDLYESAYNDGQNNPNGYSSSGEREDTVQHALKAMRAQAGEGGE